MNEAVRQHLQAIRGQRVREIDALQLQVDERIRQLEADINLLDDLRHEVEALDAELGDE